MLKWFKQRLKQYHITKGQCPYCWEEMEQVLLYDGEGNKSTLLCPYRHYGIKYDITYENGEMHTVISYMEAGGAEMKIPEEFISYDYDLEVEDETNSD